MKYNLVLLLGLDVILNVISTPFTSDVPCGIPAVQPHTKRIVGGSDITPSSWPWTVLLVDAMGMVSGTGTIIDPHVVVTAAQHFDGPDYSPISVGIPWWHVYAGQDVINTHSPGQNVYRMRQVFIHPGYDFTSLNDIAVVIMDQPFHFNRTIRPACLPDVHHLYADGQTCYVPGWVNKIINSSIVKVKNQVDMPILRNSVCQRIRKDFFSHTEICTGYKNGGKDFCSNDVGAPLMCKDRNNKWYIQGVASSGGDCSTANLLGIFKSVSSYSAWIRHTMNATGYPYHY